MTTFRPIRAALLAALLLAPVSTLRAQEFTQTFLNPSFGGNPFYSDHLLAIAGLDRPEEPEEEDDAPTADELLASQLRAQLTSSLSSDIFRTIQAASTGPFVPGAPGNTGTFVLGDQTISFVRTAGETRVTFTNGRTGEVSEIVIPASAAATSVASAAAPLTPLAASQSVTASAAGELVLRSRSVAPPLTGLRRLAPAPLTGIASGARPTGPSGEASLLAPPPLQ